MQFGEIDSVCRNRRAITFCCVCFFSNRAGCYDNNQNGLIINNNFQCSIINRRCQLFGCYRFSHILSLSAETYGHFNCDVFNDACDLYAMIQYCTV